MNFYIKIHKSYRSVVAISDEDIIGKRFEEGKRQLHLRENFYQGELVSEEEAIRQIRKQAISDASFNIVGEKSIKLAIKAGLIKESNVDKIGGIPFTLILV